MFFIYFLVGLYFLIKGADLLTDGAAALAGRFNLNQVIIGLTVIAFGTSAPELFVSISSVLNNSSGILFGNIFGSVIINISLVLGLASIFGIVDVHKRLVKLELPFTLLVSFFLFLALNDSFFGSNLVNQLDKFDGLILLSLFAFFVWTLFSYKEGLFEEKPDFILLSKLKTFLYILFGFLFLIFGSHQVVSNGLEISRIFGLNQTLIGALLISLGTSLPEIVTSFTAFKKNNHELMIGNVVGSNIFNLLLVLGISSTLKPIEYLPSVAFHFHAMVLVQVLLFVFLFFRKDKNLTKSLGFIFLIFYLLYFFLNFY
ncbi:sodium:proton exchanger [bacterium]|nr:sodium:proton exchanger [bacterium]